MGYIEQRVNGTRTSVQDLIQMVDNLSDEQQLFDQSNSQMYGQLNLVEDDLADIDPDKLEGLQEEVDQIQITVDSLTVRMENRIPDDVVKEKIESRSGEAAERFERTGLTDTIEQIDRQMQCIWAQNELPDIEDYFTEYEKDIEVKSKVRTMLSTEPQYAQYDELVLWRKLYPNRFDERIESFLLHL